jgi:hypothetical protein
MLRNFFHSGVQIRLRWGLLLILAAGAIPAPCGWADTGMLHLRCTNPASGTNWPVVIDLDHALVDSLPATITAKWISWRDPKQGLFDLERATWKLQFRNASATGGYYLFYTCRPE